MPKTKKRKIIPIVLGIMLLALCAWRFLPHPFSEVVPADLKCLTGIKMNAIIYATENSGLKMETYSASFSVGEEEGDEILELLTSADYRQDFRNPIIALFNGITVYGGHKVVYVQLRWGTEAEKTCVLQFLSENLVSVIQEDGVSSRLYHPSNHNMMDELATYIQKSKETE